MTRAEIDPARFLADLDRLRDFGRTGTGVVRPAFSPADLAARRWLAGRMGEAGLRPVFDPAGNLFGLPSGEAPCLLVGSHTDSQPEGGWLDGPLGTIAGLEAARACREAGLPQPAVVSFQDEEGRFGAMTGSDIWTGRLPLDRADRLTDAGGLSFAAARAAIAAEAEPFVPPARFAGFVEAHIEQGPVLDASGGTLGVVETIVGFRQLPVTLTGAQNHAGTTPMAGRRDAVQGFVAASSALGAAFAPLVTPETVWTIGQVAVHPNAASIIPGRVRFSLQWRDADAARLDAMEDAARATLARVAAERGLGLAIGEGLAIPPSAMAPVLIARAEAAAHRHAPGGWRRMRSGALHDAANLSRLMPAVMVFAPSIGGISHDFAEDTRRDDLVTCARVVADIAAGGPP